MSAPSAAEVLERLEILHKNLEDEGLYVRANTAWLAIEEIRRLRVKQQMINILWNERLEVATDLLTAAKNMAHASHVIAGTPELEALRRAIEKASER